MNRRKTPFERPHHKCLLQHEMSRRKTPFERSGSICCSIWYSFSKPLVRVNERFIPRLTKIKGTTAARCVQPNRTFVEDRELLSPLQCLFLTNSINILWENQEVYPESQKETVHSIRSVSPAKKRLLGRLRYLFLSYDLSCM